MAVLKPKGVVCADGRGWQLHWPQWDVFPVQGLSRHGEMGPGASGRLHFNLARSPGG